MDHNEAVEPEETGDPSSAESAPAQYQTPVDTKEMAQFKQEINERLKVLGRDVTIDNVHEKYGDALKGMTDLGRKAADERREKERYKPLVDQLEQNPDLRDKFRGMVEEYYGVTPQVVDDSSLGQVLNPLQAQLTAKEFELSRIRMEGQVNALREQHKDFWTEEVQKDVLLYCADKDSSDVNGAFVTLFGTQAIAHQTQQAKEQMLKEIQANNSAYSGSAMSGMESSGGSISRPAEGTPEADEYELREVEKIMNDPTYRQQVLSAMD